MLKSAKLAIVFCVILCGFLIFPLVVYANTTEEVQISFTVGAEYYVVTVGDNTGYIHVPAIRNRLTLNDGRPTSTRETIALLLGIRHRATAQDAIFTNANDVEFTAPLASLLLVDIAGFAGATSVNWNATTQTISFTIRRALTADETRRLNRSPFVNTTRERLTVAQLFERINTVMPHIDRWNRSETPFPMLPDRRLNANEIANWRVLHNQWGITAREMAFVHRINEERARPHINADALIICPYLSQLARFNIQTQLDIGVTAVVSNHPRYGETVSLDFGRYFDITTRGGRFSIGVITSEPNVNFMSNLETNYRPKYTTLIAGRIRYIGIGSLNNVTYIIVADASHSQNYS